MFKKIINIILIIPAIALSAGKYVVSEAGKITPFGLTLQESGISLSEEEVKDRIAFVESQGYGVLYKTSKRYFMRMYLREESDWIMVAKNKHEDREFIELKKEVKLPELDMKTLEDDLNTANEVLFKWLDNQEAFKQSLSHGTGYLIREIKAVMPKSTEGFTLAGTDGTRAHRDESHLPDGGFTMVSEVPPVVIAETKEIKDEDYTIVET